MVEPLTKEQAAFQAARAKLGMPDTKNVRLMWEEGIAWQAAQVPAPARAPQAGVWKNFQDRLFQCDLADPDLREALICLATDMLTQGQQTGVLDGWTIEQLAKAAREREAMLKALESEWKRVKPLIEPVWSQT